MGVMELFIVVFTLALWTYLFLFFLLIQCCVLWPLRCSSLWLLTHALWTHSLYLNIRPLGLTLSPFIMASWMLFLMVFTLAFGHIFSILWDAAFEGVVRNPPNFGCC